MNLQTSYVILALVLFTTLALVFNQKENNDLEFRLYHEAVVAAAELGDSFLSELSKMPFDENTISSTVDTSSALTLAYSLGPESGETNVLQFDDMDDYNRYVRIDSLNKLGEFSTTVSVYYVNIAYPNVLSSSKQFYKRIDIEIDNYYLTDPVNLFYISAY